MKMNSKPYWLKGPVDVKIIDCPSSAGTGFCIIKSIDYFEDIQEQDDEELASFSDVHDAFAWLANKGYTAVDEGCGDGVYRHRNAAEWFYERIDAKPVKVMKRYKHERKPMTAEQRRIQLMLAA